MTENLPVDNEQNSRGNENGRRDSGRFLAIDNFHYHGNDLAEIRKIAELNPDLAEKLIIQRDRSEERVAASYKFGVGATVTLLGLLMLTSAFILVKGGILHLIASVAVILAAAVLIRVVLTGEWSETSWVGKILNFFMKALGGSKPEKDEG